MSDSEIRIITAASPEEFTEKVNQLLSFGVWRIAETEMSVTDHHYWAMLIREPMFPNPTTEKR